MKHFLLALALISTMCKAQQQPITFKVEEPLKLTGATIIAITSITGGLLAMNDPKDPTQSPGMVVIFGGFAIGTTVYFGRPEKQRKRF